MSMYVYTSDMHVHAYIGHACVCIHRTCMCVYTSDKQVHAYTCCTHTHTHTYTRKHQVCPMATKKSRFSLSSGAWFFTNASHANLRPPLPTKKQKKEEMELQFSIHTPPTRT